MKKLLLIFCAVACCLCGCTKDMYYCGDTYSFEIPISDNVYSVVSLPTECILVETDSVTYWKFIDGTTIYRMLNSSKGTSKFDSANKVYYTTNSVCVEFDNNTSLVMSTTKDNNKMMRKLLGQTVLNSRDVTLGEKERLESLPTYDDKVPMEFTDANLYMPVGSKATTFDGSSAQIYVNGLSFCESWVMLRKIDQLKPILLNYLICNDTTITDWYQDDDMFYAETSSRIIAAKKLTQNQYICYIASSDMKDFLLKGINTIRLDKENIG